MELELPRDFREFLSVLNARGVEYLLIGGYAVGYHGQPRATQDMDIWIAMSPDNAERITAALREFGFDVPDLAPGLFLKERNIIRLGVPPVRIEIAMAISGLQFDECFARKVVDTLAGVQVNLISLDDLKTNKRAAGRLKDLADLENLP